MKKKMEEYDELKSELEEIKNDNWKYFRSF